MMRICRPPLLAVMFLLVIVGGACRKKALVEANDIEDFPLPAAVKPAESAPAADQSAVAEAERDFAIRFLKQAKPTGNFVWSPESISMALAMVRTGAHGETERELAKLLAQTIPAGAADRVYANRLFDWSNPGRDITLRSANSLWGNGFTPDYGTRVGRDYLASVRAVDWSNPAAVVRRVNHWADRSTEGMIPAVLAPEDLSADTVALLLNATYFKGAWADPFDVDRTDLDDFTLLDGKIVSVPTMSQREPGHLPRVNFNDGVAVSLPFRGDRFRMVFVLPKSADGLAKLEENLTAKQLEEWTAVTEREQIDLRLPKFQFTTHRLLNDDLKRLGARLIFQPEADFGGMTADRWFVGKVIQEARVEVDETGAKAAAVTAVEMKKSAPPQARLIRFDHPFLFLIVDSKSKTLLFLGRVTDPREK